MDYKLCDRVVKGKAKQHELNSLVHKYVYASDKRKEQESIILALHQKNALLESEIALLKELLLEYELKEINATD
jgi:hypothetical protein